MKRLEKKVAIVTGAAKGIGESVVKAFLKEGATVVATDIDENSLDILREGLKDDYKDYLLTIKHDVSKSEEWEQVVDRISEAYGKVDILVNNAGVGGADYDFEDEATNLENWNQTMSVDAAGSFLGIKFVTPLMKKSATGSIINVSSISADIPLSFASISYQAAKSAVNGLTRASAKQLSKYSIRVNTILPGIILTPIYGDISQDEIDAFGRLSLLDAVGAPEDIAHACVYLGSEEAKFITGTELTIDGGLSVKGD
jgi:NAD(P)-dependent dehydrogenase (short-subunit alcohol dehydrogenase family)